MTATPRETRAITARDLATLDHLAEMPVIFHGWTFPDGSPLAFRVRALTFAERRAAIRAATVDGVLDDELYAIEAVWRGIITPSLTRPQMDILWELNATIIDQLADTITRKLAIMSPADIRAELERLAGRTIPAPTAPAEADAGADVEEPNPDAPGDAPGAARGRRSKRPPAE